MSTDPATLLRLTRAIELMTGTTSASADSEDGYWKRIAEALEEHANLDTGSNDTVEGYMLRAARALELKYAGGPIESPVNLTLPSITGTAQVGQTITLSDGTWSNG